MLNQVLDEIGVKHFEEVNFEDYTRVSNNCKGAEMGVNPK